MPRKKKIKIETEKVNVDIQKEGQNVSVNLDTENVDVQYIKDEVQKTFKLDSKNLDIDITKTDTGIDVSINAKTPFWKMVGKRIAKWISKKFSKK